MPWRFEMLDVSMVDATSGIAAVYAGCTFIVSAIFLIDVVRERLSPAPY